VPPSDTLSVAEAAEALELSARTVRQWCADGKLRASRVGRRWRIHAAALSASAEGPSEPGNAALAALEREMGKLHAIIAEKDGQIADLAATAAMFQERSRNLDAQVKLLTAGPEPEQEESEQPKSWWRRILRR